jgi:hypothetical protein
MENSNFQLTFMIEVCQNEVTSNGTSKSNGSKHLVIRYNAKVLSIVNQQYQTCKVV